MRVFLAARVKKKLKKIPKPIVGKLLAWADSVECCGIHEIRKLPGYHDEPLRGERAGQRSLRLGIKWRAIYVEEKDGALEFIEVQEVTPHDY